MATANDKQAQSIHQSVLSQTDDSQAMANQTTADKTIANMPVIDQSALTNVIDFDSLNKQLNECARDFPEQLINPTLIKHLQNAVSTIDDGLKVIYQRKHDADTVVYGRSNMIDKLIKAIYRYLLKDLDQEISIVAVGGYGRGELHPKSDIDLMILLKDEENQNTKDLLEKCLTLLWDVRLEIGHSVRTIEECIDEAKKDITVATNIMESRLLAGSESLFDQMKEKTSTDHIWDSKSFFLGKLKEQVQRNGKYNDTAYNLEPNLKESSGGLRDIQMIAWVAKRHFNANSLHDLVKEGFLLESELDTLLKGQQLLWRIRCSLHYLSGRREDRLLFDYQRDLALEYGFKDNEENSNNEAIEQFMQQYYRTVIKLEQLNEMLLQHFREVIIYANLEQETEQINNCFQLRNGYIETTSATVFEKTPCAILEMFIVLQEHPEIQGVRAATIRQIQKYKYLVNDKFRRSRRAHLLFIKIITSSRGVTHELRRMNNYGILAAYLPAFDSIVGRMQYDLFHAYTVDQHTLFVIRNMRRLAIPDYCHEFPLASGVFQHLANPGLLYIAGLFHDIAKGRPGDHAELGAIDAKEFCNTHGLRRKDSKLVSWLVQNHLIMSMTAQRMDISDPDVISGFATKMKTLKRLDYLYILTICDMRGTNPKLWNDWKDKLVAELYNKTAAYINKGVKQKNDKEDYITETQTASLRRLEQNGINSHQANELWETLNPEYFQTHTFGQIAWHTRLIINARLKKTIHTPLIQARVHESSNSIQLVIYMKDRDHIFHDVVTVLSNSEVDIVNAHIVNASDGNALQTYRLSPVNIQDSDMDLLAEQTMDKLQQRLNHSTGITETFMHNSSKHKHFSSPTVISFENPDDYTTHVTIETLDRIGVLANIAKTFVECKLRLLNARIATAGEKTMDHFTISTMEDTSLSQAQQEYLKKQLKESL